MRVIRLLALLAVVAEFGVSASPSAAQTPRALWEKRVVKAPTIAPLLLGDTVWVAGTGRKLRAFDARTGERYWSRNLETYPVVPAVAAGGIVVLGLGLPEPSLAAFKRDSGKEVWRVSLSHHPVGLLAIDPVIVSVTVDGQVEARSSVDGSVLWFRQLNGPMTGLSPTSSGPCVLSRQDSLWRLDLKVGRTEWSVPISGVHAAGPWTSDSLLVTVSYDGLLQVRDLATGTVRDSATVERPQVSPPAVEEGTIVTVATGGEMSVRAFPTLERLWTVKRTGTVSASATPWSRWWIVPTLRGEVFAIDRQRGATAWSLRFKEPISVRPAVSNDFLVLIDDRGRMVVYTLEGAR